jgi:diguanylate cyclase (GGDEF)-like protein/PAS domain S-box-containing protein
MLSPATTPSADVASAGARVLLLVEHRENSRLLAEWLGRDHEVVVDVDRPPPPTDLIIVDGSGLQRHRQRVLDAKAAARPAFLPSLLAARRRQMGRLHAELLSPVVDEVITTPIQKVELRARLNSLLRIRQLSLDAAGNALRRYRELFDGVPAGLFVADAHGRLVDANPALARLLGISHPRSLLGTRLEDVFERDEDRFRWQERAAAGATASDVEVAVRRDDGSTGWLSLTMQPVRDADGRVIRMEGSAADVSGHRLAAALLRARAAQQTAVAALGGASLSGTPIDEVLAQAATEVTETLGTDRTEIHEVVLAGRTTRLRAVAGVALGPDQATAPIGELGGQGEPFDLTPYAVAGHVPVPARLAREGLTSAAGVAIGGRGQPYGVLTTYSRSRASFSHEETDFLQAVATTLGLAVERRDIEANLRHQSLHDALTGLPNRVLALDRLAHALQNLARYPEAAVAVLFLDIDRFKLINDQLGHAAGDQVLVQLARAITIVLRPGDTLARLGGDEFVVICEELSGAADAIPVAKRIDDVARSVELVDRDIEVRVSIGIAVATEPDVSPVALLADADAALYTSKERGRAGYALFSESMRVSTRQRVDLGEALRGAVERDELDIVYQPLVDLSDGRISSCEALVRWRHPERGLLQPDDFLDVAEDAGSIVPIGEWVLAEACRRAASWSGARDIGVAVNLSARQFAEPDLARTVAGAMAVAGLAPPLVTLEVAEDVLMGDAEASLRVLASLEALGVQLSIDDVGTGYSSLAYLSRLPVGTLKVDGSVILGLPGRSEDVSVLDAVVGLAEAFGLQVVAEGVESAEQLEAVTARGVRYAQGFHLAPPLSPAEVEALLVADLPLTGVRFAATPQP